MLTATRFQTACTEVQLNRNSHKRNAHSASYNPARRKTHELSAVWTHWMAGGRNWIRHVGHGRMDRVAGRRIAGVAAAGHRSWMQFFRHCLGVRRWPQRRVTGQSAAREFVQKIIPSYESP